MIPEIRTARLVLRGWTDADREPYAALNADPLVMEFIGPLQTPAEASANVDRMLAHWAEHGFGLWCVELDGTCIGFTGLATPGFMPAVEVGWRLASAQWGHGYATEAARAALAFGFGQVGLDEIVSFTTVRNVRSRRVMDKLGMVRDPAADFDHPRAIPELRRHVLYRLPSATWAADDHGEAGRR
jgi:ribosomal-protein-alanine N-acetyltransferase